MSKICILTADRELYDKLALLSEQKGHTATNEPGAYPLVWDADTVALPRLTSAQAVIAICRTPESICDAAARRCCRILSRPFEFECFDDALDSALSGIGRQLIPPSRRNDRAALTLDEPRRRLVCGQKSVILTPSETALLNRLTERRGEVVERAELEALLAGESLTVHICSLRKKLKAICPLPLMTTVRGRGYKLD